MTGKMTPIEDYELPYMRKLSIQNHEFESGMHLLRLTFREGNRITAIDIDRDSAAAISQSLIDWAAKQ
ncbi:MAG: hypothetical protein JKY31_00110 [Rhodobacteraceae bacterium]|nr:hypothetical protein [Paracoccaceae bacterium]